MSSPVELFLVGLSHHTAPVSVREQVAFSGERIDEVLGALRALPEVREAMILSTCNRLEIYAAATQAPRASPHIRAYLEAHAPGIGPHLYDSRGAAAIRHLFRVCSSLDSMVVGEPQILGQVKEAFAQAERAEAAGGTVSRVVRKAFSVAKRVRTETDVGRAAVSMSFAAVELAKKVLGDLEGKRVLLVGAGKMSALAARHLLSAGCQEVAVVNRSPERARELARDVGGSAHPWEDLDDRLVHADVVVCSTAAPSPIIRPERIQGIRKRRRHRPLFLIDLAVPRDVDPKVNDLEDVYVFDVDDLGSVMDENRRSRQGEAYLAEQIVEEEAEAFYAAMWSEGEPLLRRLRLQAEAIAQAEVAKTLGRHGESLTEAQRESVEALARAIVNKLLHAPTSQIRDAGLRDDAPLLDAAATLFDLGARPRALGVGGAAPTPLVASKAGGGEEAAQAQAQAQAQAVGGETERREEAPGEADLPRRQIAWFGSGNS